MRTGRVAAALLALLGGALVWLMASGLSRDGPPDGPGRDAAEAADGSPGSPGAGPSGAPALTWTGSVVVDSGGGHVGPWRMNRSDWRYVDDPSVALDPEGGAAVAWVDQARKDVLFRRWAPDGEPVVDAPVNVSRSPGVFSWLPRVVVSPRDPDRVYLLWQEIVFSGGTHGGEAFFARSTDGGRSFGEPVNLSQAPAGAGKGRLSPSRWHNGSLDLALGPDGVVVAAWTVYEGGLWVARSMEGGAGFSEPLRVTRKGGEGEPARAPSLAVGPGGTVHLAWAVGEDPAADLRYAASGDGGRSFGEAEVLFAGAGHADAPKLAVDGRGTVHLAWHESPAGRVGGHRIRHARAPAGGDGFGPARTVAGPDDGLGGVPDGLRGLAGELEGLRFPSLALDGEGDPHLVWELFPGRGDRSRGLAYTASPDGGDAFGTPVLVPGTADPAFGMNGSLQGLLMRKLDVNGAGDVAVVNSAFEPAERSRVRLIRGRAGG